MKLESTLKNIKKLAELDKISAVCWYSYCTVFVLLQTLPGGEAVFRPHHNAFIDFLLCYHGNFSHKNAHCITNLYSVQFVDGLKEEPNINAPSF